MLSLWSASDSFVKLSGFHQFAYNTLQSWLQQSGKELVIEKVSTRGANWGMLKVDNHRIHFVDKEELTIFDMPITALSQTVVQGKSEVRVTHSKCRNRQRGSAFEECRENCQLSGCSLSADGWAPTGPLLVCALRMNLR